MSIGGATDDATRYCFRTLPACPACGSLDYENYGTKRTDEGKEQYCECRAIDPDTQEPICRNKFKIIWSRPPLGGILDDE